MKLNIENKNFCAISTWNPVPIGTYSRSTTETIDNIKVFVSGKDEKSISVFDENNMISVNIKMSENDTPSLEESKEIVRKFEKPSSFSENGYEAHLTDGYLFVYSIKRSNN